MCEDICRVKQCLQELKIIIDDQEFLKTATCSTSPIRTILNANVPLSTDLIMIFNYGQMLFDILIRIFENPLIDPKETIEFSVLVNSSSLLSKTLHEWIRRTNCFQKDHIVNGVSILPPLVGHDSLLCSILNLFSCLYTVIGSTIQDGAGIFVANLLDTIITISKHEKTKEFYKSPQLKQCVENLAALHTSATIKRDKSSTPKIKEQISASLTHDFRQLTVIPSTMDMQTEMNNPIFVRKNKIYGKYTSVDDYLDTQFCLLREDFISPLRNGIFDYLSNQKQPQQHQVKLRDVKIYTNTRIVGRSITNDGLVYRVKFDSNMGHRMNWNNNKRLLYGNLVCLSSDEFKTLYFATVAERNVKDLRSGNILLESVNDQIPPRNAIYVMVESVAFFTAYQFVLQRLQEMNNDNFPMNNYIVFSDKSIQYPKYLNGCDIESYMSKIASGLDKNQQVAIQTALTNEFTIIQGPPGTGKTFIGVKILQILLSELRKQRQQQRPILVLCYTNHALDQFLEACLPITTSLVRVGGQSSSSVLKEYNISNFRRGESTAKFFKLSQNLQSLYEEVNNLSSCILPLNDLLNVMMPQHADHFKRLHHLTKKHSVEDWLQNCTLNSRLPLNDRAISDILEGILVDVIVDEIHEEIIFMSKNLDFPDLDDIEMDRRCIDDDDKDYAPNSDYRDKKNHGYVSNMIREAITCSTLEEENCGPLIDLDLNQRWNLYKLWLERILIPFNEQIDCYETTCVENCQILKQSKIIRDVDAVIHKDIIGMTTTAAARCGQLIKALKPKVIIVEEAAEVLESHIISALHSDLEHLILIGDHKQLQPSTTVYKLAKDYHLDCSLFERLVLNDFPIVTLSNQHRMRPEISNLMHLIYDGITNDKSVLNYPSVYGLSSNLVFINHQNPEEKMETSYSNRFEAEYAVRLSEYLIESGYSPNQITILTLYIGQFFLIRQLSSHRVKISVVDNYQGEENDVILLSLVRSNSEKRIGFIGIENRICVALSRAKHGLYVLGDFDLLVNKSPLWYNVINEIISKKKFDVGVTTHCGRSEHPKNLIQSASDFETKRCTQICSEELSCGHLCEEECHIKDPNHRFLKCKKICNEILKCGHPCPAICSACQSHRSATYKRSKYKMSEANCMVLVHRIFDNCGHEEDIMCYKSQHAICTAPCSKFIACGHKCTKLCGETCLSEVSCKELVIKTCKRNHSSKTRCSSDVSCKVQFDHKFEKCGHVAKINCCSLDTAVCEVPCSKILQCGHKCPQKCYKECPSEVKCKEQVVSILPCSHEIKISCSEKLKLPLCKERCSSTLPCGHQCPNKCFNCDHSKVSTNLKPTIDIQCEEMVHKTFLLCGHTSLKKFKCSQSLDSIKCDNPCQTKISPCEHLCPKKCGEPCVEKCRLPIYYTVPGCQHKTESMLPCGSSLENYHCNAPVTRKRPDCNHEAVGVPCSSSSDSWGKCTQPCDKKLKQCNHPCANKCGQICTKYCNHPVTRLLRSCRHKVNTICSRDITELVCDVCNPPISSKDQNRSSSSSQNSRGVLKVEDIFNFPSARNRISSRDSEISNPDQCEPSSAASGGNRNRRRHPNNQPDMSNLGTSLMSYSSHQNESYNHEALGQNTRGVSGQRSRGSGHSNRGSGQSNRGSGQNNRGSGQNNRGSDQGNRGSGQSNRGSDQGNRGSGQNNRGSGQNNRGIGQSNRRSRRHNQRTGRNSERSFNENNNEVPENQFMNYVSEVIEPPLAELRSVTNATNPFYANDSD